MINGFILAIQFLTRIPIGKQVKFNKRNIKNSIMFYPIVGILIGVLTCLPFLLIPFTEFRISALLAIIIYFWITGGLHADGLADTLDGFLGGSSKEKTIEIMKDSRLGMFGVIGIVLLILAKYTLYTSVSTYPAFIVIAITNARFAGLHVLNNYKTSNSGLASVMSDSKIGSTEYILLLFYSITLLVYNKYYIISIIVALLTSKILARKSIMKLSYITGDIIGASIEINEITSLLTLWGIKVWILS